MPIVALLWVAPAAALAAPSSHGSSYSDGVQGERRAAQDLAHAILVRMPAAADKMCPQPTLDSLRSEVTAAIGQTNPSRDVALEALALARQQAPSGAACVLIALDDTADELDGSGSTVDDSGKVRGFTLYMGPLPSSALSRASNP